MIGRARTWSVSWSGSCRRKGSAVGSRQRQEKKALRIQAPLGRSTRARGSASPHFVGLLVGALVGALLGALVGTLVGALLGALQTRGKCSVGVRGRKPCAEGPLPRLHTGTAGFHGVDLVTTAAPTRGEGGRTWSGPWSAPCRREASAALASEKQKLRAEGPLTRGPGGRRASAHLLKTPQQA